MRHFISLTSLNATEFRDLIELGLDIKRNNEKYKASLNNKIVGIYFRGTSTRTRSAFATGAMRLGASVFSYGANELQSTTGENASDTSRVLANFLDALVIRTNSDHCEMEIFASQNTMAVINAMSDQEHPTQAVADFITMKETFGSLEGLHVLYIGEGNNTASALVLGCSYMPQMKLTVITPEGFGLDPQLIESLRSRAEKIGTLIQQSHDVSRLPEDVDAVYATRWQTMGVEKNFPNWREHFAPYQVNESLMKGVSRSANTRFLHDLPAVRGEDVTDEVLDGPQSIAFQQAGNKLFGAMAVMHWCLHDSSFLK